MTIGMGLYLLAVSLSLVVAAAIGEWLLERLHRPSRWVWAAALGLSVLLPALPGIPLTVRRVAQTAVEPSGEPAQAVVGSAALESSVAEPPAWAMLSVSDSAVRLLSLATATLLLVAWVLLLLRARRWRRGTMDGTQVLVAATTGPAVIGFFQPRIVVPQWAFDLPADQRRMLLAHEQSHIDARDPLLLLLSGLVVVLAPWNPCVWFALRRLRGAIEIDCDRRVLAAGTMVSGYARCLVDSATRAMTAQLLPVGSLALSSSFLERRIAIMVRTVRLSKVTFLLGLLVATGFVFLAGATRPPVAAKMSDDQALAGIQPALEEQRSSTERYYARLTSGKLTQPQILWNVFNADFSLRRQTQAGEGC